MILPLLRDNYPEIEADLQQFYNINLDDWHLGKIRHSRLLRLIMSLPPESRFVRANTDGKADWGNTEHLLAHILDVLNIGNWQRGGGKGGRPKPVKRPGKGDQKTRQYGKTNLSPKQAMAKLAQMRNGELSNVGKN